MTNSTPCGSECERSAVKEISTAISVLCSFVDNLGKNVNMIILSLDHFISLLGQKLEKYNLQIEFLRWHLPQQQKDQ